MVYGGDPQEAIAHRDSDAGRLAAWRRTYWTSVSGPVVWSVESKAGERRGVDLERPAIWQSSADGWARRHVGMIAQTIVFTGAALLLLLMRSYDLTAGLCVLAMAFSGVGGGGPLLGVEGRIPIPIVGPILTVFAWIASPLAFPTIALAIDVLPVAVASPRSPSLAARRSARRGSPAALPRPHDRACTSRASMPRNRWPSGTPRIRGSTTRRSPWHSASTCSPSAKARIATASTTTRTSAAASGWRSTRPFLACWRTSCGTACQSSPRSAETPLPQYPAPIVATLDALVLLPAFGLVYAVGVAHVLGPRVVLRRSLQYALANRTLTLLIFLPAIALTLSLVRERDRTLVGDRQGQFGAVRAPCDRVGGDLQVSGARASMARPALLPRGVRREEDPPVAREPGAVRNGSRRPRLDGGRSARRGAPSADARDPGRRDRRGAAVSGHGAARQRGIAALRRRTRRRCFAGPTNRSRSC